MSLFVWCGMYSPICKLNFCENLMLSDLLTSRLFIGTYSRSVTIDTLFGCGKRVLKLDFVLLTSSQRPQHLDKLSLWHVCTIELICFSCDMILLSRPLKKRFVVVFRYFLFIHTACYLMWRSHQRPSRLIVCKNRDLKDQSRSIEL